MLKCHDIDELMMDHLYGELEGARAEEFGAHVAECARCQGELEGFAKTRSAFRGLGMMTPSPGVTARLLVEAAKRAPKGKKAEGGVWEWLAGLLRPLALHPGLAAAASLLLVAGVVGMLAMRGRFHASAPLQPRAPMATPAAATTPAPEPIPDSLRGQRQQAMPPAVSPSTPDPSQRVARPATAIEAVELPGPTFKGAGNKTKVVPSGNVSAGNEGLLDNALALRRGIRRVDPDYYNRRVANDPTFAACDERQPGGAGAADVEQQAAPASK